jgi:hypothetical protein
VFHGLYFRTMISSFRKAILLCLLLNALASALMLLFLRQGVDPSLEVIERVRYIAAHPGWWRLSWLVWMAAALSLIYFFIHWGLFLDGHAPRALIIFGVIVGSLGMMPDILAETLFLGLLPRLGQEILQAPEGSQGALLQSFAHWQWATTLVSGFVGNGFYALGGLILNGASHRSGRFRKIFVWLGWPTWVFAVGLSVSTAGMWRTPLILFTALTMGWFLFWLMVLLIFLQEVR